MKDRFFVLSEETLGLRTNVDNFKWSYGIDAPSVKKAAYDVCTVKLELRVDPLDDIKKGVLVSRVR